MSDYFLLTPADWVVIPSRVGVSVLRVNSNLRSLGKVATSHHGDPNNRNVVLRLWFCDLKSGPRKLDDRFWRWWSFLCIVVKWMYWVGAWKSNASTPHSNLLLFRQIQLQSCLGVYSTGWAIYGRSYNANLRYDSDFKRQTPWFGDVPDTALSSEPRNLYWTPKRELNRGNNNTRHIATEYLDTQV